MLAHAHFVFSYSKNSGNNHQNENRFLAFGSLINNAEVVKAIMSHIIDSVEFSEI